MLGRIGTLGVISSALLIFGGCRPATVNMRSETPLEVRRGYCILETEFKQNGQRLNRDSVMQRLSRSRDAAPYVKQGNGYAVASILATIGGTSALVVGSLGKQKTITMSDGTSTTLIASGFAVAALSWVLCITSDGKYVAAAEAYNSRFVDRPKDEPASDPQETWE